MNDTQQKTGFFASIANFLADLLAEQSTIEAMEADDEPKILPTKEVDVFPEDLSITDRDDWG